MPLLSAAVLMLRRRRTRSLSEAEVDVDGSAGDGQGKRPRVEGAGCDGGGGKDATAVASVRRARSPRVKRSGAVVEAGCGDKDTTPMPSACRARLLPPGVEAVGCGDEAGTASALPGDMLLEVFKRLPPPTDIVRCAAVCRLWRRVISGAGCLPAPPRHFGFFRNYVPSPLPPFVPTAGVHLDLNFLPVSPACGAVLKDCRGRRLLLRELGAGFQRELKLIVCNPLNKTHVGLPSRYIAGHSVACCVLVPGEGAAFRVVVVLFGEAPIHFEVLIYSSTSQAWEAATGPLKRPLLVRQGPSVVVGDVVYKLQVEDGCIMAIDMAKMALSAMLVPDTKMLLYTGNHWIGKTEDGRLCFFAIREQLALVKWVLEAPGKWAEQPPVALNSLIDMGPAAVGDLHRTKLSARIADQLRGCKLVSFAGFCQDSETLFLVMADRVVALSLRTWRMERLWRNTDEWRPLGDVYPYEMVSWPPAAPGLEVEDLCKN